MIDQVRARFGVDIQTETLGAQDRHELEGVTAAHDLHGLLLSPQVRSSSWVKSLTRRAPEGVVMGAPFVLGNGQRVAHMIWPHEEVARIKTPIGMQAAGWTEMSQLLPIHLEAAARSAQQLARERQAPLIWVSGGLGGQEDFALKVVQNVLQSEFTVVAVENLQSAILDRLPGLSGSTCVLLSTGRVAVLLSRLLKCQAWLSWQERGMSIAQGWGALGPALSVSFLLQRFGLVTESLAIESAAIELFLQASHSTGSLSQTDSSDGAMHV